MRSHMRMASLLLAATLAIAGQTIQLPRFDQSRADPVPRPVLFSARESLAAINQFISDGDLAALWQTLDRVGHGLVPWPEPGPSDRDQIALAFRATFPDLRLDLASIEPSDDGYEVHLDATETTGSVPAWLDTRIPPVFTTIDMEVSSDDGNSIERLAIQPLAFPLVASVPNPGARFLLATPSRLFVARVTLMPSATNLRYLAVHAPSLVAPQSGSLQLDGAGRIFVLRQGDAVWTTLLANDSTTLHPGDLLYVPSGHAILTMTTPNPISFFYAGVAEASPLAQTIDEDGRPVPPDIAQLASTTDTDSISAWFGTVEPLMSKAISSPARSMSLVPEWVVLSPGASVVPAHGTLFVSCAFTNGTTGELATPLTVHMENSANEPAILLMARLIPADS